MKNDISISSLSVGATASHGTQATVSSGLSGYDDSSSGFGSTSLYLETASEKPSLIFDVAKWFLHKESMSNKKLQKICYYVYAWFLVFFNDMEANAPLDTLCPTGFQAWVHGPVCPELYATYRVFGWNNIPAVERCPKFSEDVTDLFEQVWSTYGSFSADELERLTHSEMPWKKAREGLQVDEPSTSTIDDKLIFQYYSEMMEQ